MRKPCRCRTIFDADGMLTTPAELGRRMTARVTRISTAGSTPSPPISCRQTHRALPTLRRRARSAAGYLRRAGRGGDLPGALGDLHPRRYRGHSPGRSRTRPRLGGGNRFDAIFSTDGDSDRPLVADETGKWLRGDVAGILTARYCHAEAVVVPVSCNTAVERCGWFARGAPHAHRLALCHRRK